MSNPLINAVAVVPAGGGGVLSGGRPDINVTATIFFIIFKSLLVTY